MVLGFGKPKPVKETEATGEIERVYHEMNQSNSTEVGKLSLIRNATALNTNLTTEITPLLHKIEAKTLILWGEDDKFQLLKFAERLSDDIPNAELIRVKDARHFVMIDQPEAVADHVSLFLEKNR